MSVKQFEHVRKYYDNYIDFLANKMHIGYNKVYMYDYKARDFIIEYRDGGLYTNLFQSWNAVIEKAFEMDVKDGIALMHKYGKQFIEEVTPPEFK